MEEELSRSMIYGCGHDDYDKWISIVDKYIPIPRVTIADQKYICLLYEYLSGQFGPYVALKILAPVILDKLYDVLVNIQVQGEISMWNRPRDHWRDRRLVDAIRMSLDGKGGLNFSGIGRGVKEKEIILKKIRDQYALMDS
jgi:hypothetical protein